MTRCDSVRLTPDPRRVIAKSFVPREEVYADGSTRMDAVLLRLLAMSEQDVSKTLDGARHLFAGRHRDLDAVFDRSFGVVVTHLDGMGASGTSPIALTGDRRQLIVNRGDEDRLNIIAADGRPPRQRTGHVHRWSAARGAAG